ALHASRVEPTELAQAIANESDTTTMCVVADLEQPAAADAIVPRVVDELGRLDILVNNAGIIRRADATAHSDEDWDAVFNVNVTGVFRLCRAAGAHMLERGSGKIINIASLLSFQGGIRVPA